MRGLDDVEYCCLGVSSRWQWPLAIVRLARLLLKKRIDILQTHLYDAGILGIAAARIARPPLVIVTRHHLDQVHMIGTRFHVAIDRWMARAADWVVVPSEAVRVFMASHERVSEDRIAVVHYGFDFESWTATDADRQRVRAEFGFSSEFVIGCVGSFSATKGQVCLLEAVKALLPQIPQIRVLLLGTGNRAPVDRAIRAMELTDHVTFAGFRSDVPACMRAMDLLVHPSVSESFCQVLVESQAVGTAVVACRVGGIPEVVKDGETGVLVPPADAEAIRAAILDLYRHPELRQRLAAAGPADVRTRFKAERMVAQYVDCYDRWLKAP
jgi:glycosyltransferase involved in cell wall biosynthesis